METGLGERDGIMGCLRVTSLFTRRSAERLGLAAMTTNMTPPRIEDVTTSPPPLQLPRSNNRLVIGHRVFNLADILKCDSLPFYLFNTLQIRGFH